METHTISNFRPLLRTFYLFLSAIAVLWAVPRNAQAQLYVLQTGSPGNGHIGTVSEYSTNGELINANLITGLNDPTALAVSGNTLFVTNNVPSGTVGKYDATTGGAINAGFITGLTAPNGLAVSNNRLFVTTYSNQQGYGVGEYDATTGAAINANLITGLNAARGLAVSDNKLFVSTFKTRNGGDVFTVGKFDATTGATINAKFIKGLDLRVAKGNTLYGLVGFHHNTVAEYDAINGSAINPSLITGLKFPSALAVLGNKIFVAEYERDRVGEYDATTGAVINANFITGTMDFPIAIAVKRTK